ncbi:MAG TPA: DNA alkylation repair protein [Prolixibacteraceae bacterium]|nr:DNA alkylation repair protein [Prolixibacteraceae bacterium]
MTTNELVQEIKSYCIANADEERIVKSQRYFKEEFIGYGLTSKQIQDKVEELLKGNKLDLQTILDTTPLLMKSGKYEEIAFALLLLNGFWKEYTLETFLTIGNWFTISIHNWAHADILGMYILPKFMDRNIITMDDLSSWLESPFKFQRRCVPVTLIKHIKKTRQVMPSIVFVEKLMSDTGREVHQGMGWFLREAWKISPSEVEIFLEKWKDTAPRLIIQYACEKMTAENKLRFKRAKKLSVRSST